MRLEGLDNKADGAVRAQVEDHRCTRARCQLSDGDLVADMSREEVRVRGARKGRVGSAVGKADEDWLALIPEHGHSPSHTFYAAPEVVVAADGYEMLKNRDC